MQKAKDILRGLAAMAGVVLLMAAGGGARADGFGTMQDCLAYLVRAYIERIEANEKV